MENMVERDVHKNESLNLEKDGVHVHVHVAKWKFDYVQEPFIVTSVLMAVASVKILYHHCKKLSQFFPESCLLILLGLAFGCLFMSDKKHFYYKVLEYDEKTFFLYLLPPIILEAAYSLKDRSFFENLVAILWFAVVGTILNCVLIGVSLYALSQFGAMGHFQIGFAQCLIFSSLIAAVDPVAVLAIFQEVGVNKVLYYMVFGESLLNDAVTVVLYNLMVTFDKVAHITANDIALGFVAFFCVSIGGLAIGLICGFITAYVTKFTTHIRVVEPVMMFGMAYSAYLMAEMVHFSGIISIIGCGLVQAQYAFENISNKSYITVNYFSKVASSMTESLIFIILGVMLINDRHYWKDWQTEFSIFALLLCIIARFIGVFGLTFFVNKYMIGARIVSCHEQVIMAYGGLRGAMSFSLVFLLDDSIETKNTMLCATYLIILFTVFAQGMTIKPLVHCLHIALQQNNSDEKKVFNEVTRGAISNMVTCIEAIIGSHGASYWGGLAQYFSQHFIRPAVLKKPTRSSSGIVNAAEESTIKDQIKKNDSCGLFIAKESLLGELQQLDEEGTDGKLGNLMVELQERKDSERRHEKRGPILLPRKPISLDDAAGLLKLRKLMVPITSRLHMDIFDRNLTRDHEHGVLMRDHMHNMTNVRKSLRQRHKQKSKTAEGVFQESLPLLNIPKIKITDEELTARDHSSSSSTPKTGRDHSSSSSTPKTGRDRSSSSSTPKAMEPDYNKVVFGL